MEFIAKCIIAVILSPVMLYAWFREKILGKKDRPL